MLQVRLRGNSVERRMVIAHRNFPRARRALLADLASQVERRAIAQASGGKAPPRSMPIPQRTHVFRNGFGIELGDTRAAVYNSARYARALHQGFRPYGNTHVIPVPARPYFDIAVQRVDVDRAQTVFDAALGPP